jgi:hypothetical protein
MQFAARDRARRAGKRHRDYMVGPYHAHGVPATTCASTPAAFRADCATQPQQPILRAFNIPDYSVRVYYPKTGRVIYAPIIDECLGSSAGRTGKPAAR